MTPTPQAQTPQAVFARLESWCRERDYRGWDPFDGLESRLFRATPFRRSALLRLVWLQLFKRSPVNARALAGVPRLDNPAALALFARGYGLTGDTAREGELARRLLAMRSTRWSGPGNGWGYPFDWQARAFAVAKDTPNAIATAYAVRTLAEAEARAGIDATPAILDAARFVAGTLVRRRGDDLFLGYVPGSDAMVHNANLWSAYVLAEGARRGGDPAWRGLALDAIAHSLSAQAADGSWRYGEAGHHRFIDSFHTGYNLEALALCAGLLGGGWDGGDWDGAIRRGKAFYEANFFTPDGQPKYYHDRLWPTDPTCTAQALITLLTVAPTGGARDLADRVLAWTIDRMWLPRAGHFAYQAHARWTNRIAYMRWTQAWMFLGLAVWLSHRENPAEPEGGR